MPRHNGRCPERRAWVLAAEIDELTVGLVQLARLFRVSSYAFEQNPSGEWAKRAVSNASEKENESDLDFAQGF